MILVASAAGTVGYAGIRKFLVLGTEKCLPKADPSLAEKRCVLMIPVALAVGTVGFAMISRFVLYTKMRSAN